MLVKRISIPVCDLKFNQSYQNMSPLRVNGNGENGKYSEMGKRKYSEAVEFKSSFNSPHKTEESSYCKRVKVVDIESEENAESDEVSDDEKIFVPSKRVRKCTRRAIKESSSDEDWTEKNESSSDEWTEKKIKTVKRKEKLPAKKTMNHCDNKSEYEKMVEKQKAESLAFLKSLKMEEAKADLEEVIHTTNPSVNKKKIQQAKKSFKKVEYPRVVRRSNRLAQINIDLSEDALYIKAFKEAEELEKKRFYSELVIKSSGPDKIRSFASSLKTVAAIRKTPVSYGWGQVKTIPEELPLKQALYFEELYDDFIKDINIQNSKEESYCDYNQDVIKQLNLEESNVAKVTPDRISAIAWHPSSDTLIVAAGSKYGNLGIWNVDSESSPYVLKIHLEGITNLKFNPWNTAELISSSYDGVLRSGNMVEHVFNEIYNVADQTCCTYFDFLSETAFLVAQKNGQVAIVDNRVRKQSEKKHKCHDYSIKTVSVHPVHRNYFLTAETKGLIRLWDLRKLQKEPIANIAHHKRCTNSAFFSPLTGNSILTTSADDTLCIFDSSNLKEDIPLRKSMKHNNLTGRWLSIFRATWLPNSDEAFVIGSMKVPRRIQVYNKNMEVVHIITHEHLSSISSTNAFHPYRHALVGGNSSGKAFVFT